MLTLLLATISLTACAPEATDDTSNPADAVTESDAGFVKIPASTFDMGDTPGQPYHSFGVHSVTLTHAYYVGVTEVTQGQFQAVMGYNPAHFTDCDGLGPDNCPADQVNWYEAAAYANAVSDAAGLQECYTCTGSGRSVECEVGPNPYECRGYRLLTEAEWEGAARCGTDTAYAGSDTPADVAWTGENSNGSTHTVAALAPNACGLYDMSGNVAEQTQDWADDYPSGSVTDPMGGETGDYRIVRGGDWTYNDSSNATVSGRSVGGLIYRNSSVGLRLTRSIP